MKLPLAPSNASLYMSPVPTDGLASYHPNLRAERKDHVITVTIDRPESKNACTGDMWVPRRRVPRRESLGQRGDRPHRRRRQLLLGRRSERRARQRRAAVVRQQPRRHARARRRLLAIHQCPVPVVAKVGRLCVGAAKMLSGTEAFELGFVNAVVPAAELDDAVGDVVDTIAGGPPLALSMTKRELDNASASSMAQALEVEALAQSVNVNTDDLREALLAYAERRRPEFTGR